MRSLDSFSPSRWQCRCRRRGCPCWTWGACALQRQARSSCRRPGWFLLFVVQYCCGWFCMYNFSPCEVCGALLCCFMFVGCCLIVLLFSPHCAYSGLALQPSVVCCFLFIICRLLFGNVCLFCFFVMFSLHCVCSDRALQPSLVYYLSFIVWQYLFVLSFMLF